ncbi:MAG TPA: YceI family protein [Gemmataceae bacterium]|nr:YceI family protein [Gemmataceae bacterium]
MFAVVIIMLGVVGFFIWNQQVDHERPMAPDSSVGRELGNGQDQSEAKPDSRAVEGGQSARTGSSGLNLGKRDKADSKQGDGAKAYQLDIAASRVYVKVGSATRLGHWHGVEGKLKSGAISLGAGGELVFDMSSFTADTQEARKKVGLEGTKISENEAKQVTEAMLGGDVLDVEKFPTATYKIIVIKPVERQEAGDPGIYQVNGRLTLHGAEQPLAFKAKLERTNKEGIVKLSGSFAMKQTAFGIKPYSAAGGLAKVADELEIRSELLLSPGK